MEVNFIFQILTALCNFVQNLNVFLCLKTNTYRYCYYHYYKLFKIKHLSPVPHLHALSLKESIQFKISVPVTSSE